MNLEQVNTIFQHKITDGSEYQWNCYPNARFLDYESLYAHASVIFNTVDQTVYEVQVTSKDETIKPYRWLNSETKGNYLAECKKKSVDPNKAWDDVDWVDVETIEDFLDKAGAIFKGESFDTRIVVPIDLDNDTMLKLAMEAHKRDITLNQMVEQILRNLIAEHELNIT